MSEWQATDWDGGHCEIATSDASTTIEVWMGLDDAESEAIVEKILGALNE